MLDLHLYRHMLNLHRSAGAIAVVSALAVMGLATGAAAATISVDMVDSSYELESDGLLFKNFSFDLDGEASLFTLCIDGTRVTLEGPMEVRSTDQADFSMTFDVEAIGMGIIEAVRLLTPTALQDNGTPTRMLGASNVTGSATDIELTTVVFGSTDRQEDSETLVNPETSLTVTTSANIRSTGPGSSVDLMSLSNEFTLVPEPATAATLALGLLGLGLAGRRR